MKKIDELFPNAVTAEQEDNNILILYMLDKPVKNLAGQMCKYELEHRWVRGGVHVNVIGQDRSYWTSREGKSFIKKGLFASVNLF